MEYKLSVWLRTKILQWKGASKRNNERRVENNLECSEVNVKNVQSFVWIEHPAEFVCYNGMEQTEQNRKDVASALD